jgi:serine phosphatase RsbU (regulator of sigma subunit)
LCQALAANSGRLIDRLKSLAGPKFIEDDITILLLKRLANP